ncbi:MAG: hypothetical protein EAZ19_23375 [Oscillatoriales cyanobacterium]|nr:MAG: hypothetical protein EAZ19_23375 [Oscillatoriales cyanobacterium]
MCQLGIFGTAINEGRRKKEEGRRKKEEGSKCRVRRHEQLSLLLRDLIATHPTTYNFHKFVGWASRPPFLDGRDAHPTIIIKIVNYLIRYPKEVNIGCVATNNSRCY